MSEELVVVLTFALSYGLIGAYAVWLRIRLRKAEG